MTDDIEIAGNWHHVESAHEAPDQNGSLKYRKARGYASIATTATAMTTAGVGHAHYLTVAGVAGAGVLAVGTAGIGLGVAGGAMTAVGLVTSGYSAYKTNKHIEALLGIRRKGAEGRTCTCLPGAETSGELVNDHKMIWLNVLPYIIEKKRNKLLKKEAGAIGLSMITAAARVGKAVYKAAKKTRGVNRSFKAHVLARHAITHDCWLAEDIITELFSREDYLVIRTMNSTQAGEVIAGKMKSV